MFHLYTATVYEINVKVHNVFQDLDKHQDLVLTL